MRLNLSKHSWGPGDTDKNMYFTKLFFSPKSCSEADCGFWLLLRIEIQVQVYNNCQKPRSSIWRGREIIDTVWSWQTRSGIQFFIIIQQLEDTTTSGTIKPKSWKDGDDGTAVSANELRLLVVTEIDSEALLVKLVLDWGMWTLLWCRLIALILFNLVRAPRADSLLIGSGCKTYPDCCAI